MSIVSELQRLKLAKQDLIDIFDAYNVQLPASVKTEDMPPIIARMLRLETPYVTNYEYGWVNTTSTYGATATWTWQEPQGSMNDIYILKANHKYLAYICEPGTRMRCMFCTTDPTSGSSNITGFGICRRDNPPAGTTWSTNNTPSNVYIAPSDGYLIFQKDNTYDSNIRTYVMDVTYFDNPPVPTWITGE